jgi:hypothetical protein
MQTSELLEVPWGRLRAGVTVARSDGSIAEVLVVESHDATVTVLFRDGCQELHDQGDTARVVPRRDIRTRGAEASDGGSIDDLVEEFLRARDPQQIEWGADRLGASGHPRAIPALLARLGDASTFDDADVEDAVCSALVALSVMEREGNLAFALRPIEALPVAARDALAGDVFTIPGRYRRK